jgi:hypothetical protein
MTIKTTTLALTLVWGLGTSCAALAQTVDTMPMPQGPLSQAQLITSLKSHGYSDIKLTTQPPNPTDPHPELTMSVSSMDDATAQTTAVHLGWNGTAIKNGERVNVYLRPEAPDTGNKLGGLMVYLDKMALGAK